MRHLILAGTALALTSGCVHVRPNLQPGSSSIDGIPRLTRTTCDLPDPYKGVGYIPAQGQELGGIAAILLSGLITKGVDLLGEKLKAKGEEKTRTLEAQLNFEEDPGVSCFRFERGRMQFDFAMLPPVGRLQDGSLRVDHRFVSFRVVRIAYPETINLQNSGVRGLSLTWEILKPGATDVLSQTISLRNVQVGTDVTLAADGTNPFTSAYLQNPFVKSETAANEANARPRLVRDLPFTLRVKLTEIRNANELYKLAGEVVESQNDALTAALIKAAGVKASEDENDTDQDQAQPPGTEGQNSAATQPPDGVN